MNKERLTEEEAEELFNTGVLRKDLVALGEREVRSKLNRGDFGNPGLESFAAVAAWIADAEFERLQTESRSSRRRSNINLIMTILANVIAIAAIIIASN